MRFPSPAHAGGLQAVASSSGRVAMSVMRTPPPAGAEIGIHECARRGHVVACGVAVRAAAGLWGGGRGAMTMRNNVTRRSSRVVRSLAQPDGSRARGRQEVTSAMDSNVGETEYKRDNSNMRINTLLLVSLFGSLIARGYQKESQRWRGWTLEEELTRIPHDFWSFYVHASADHALLTPAVITGFTYFFADWISQTYEGRFALDFDRPRLLRSAAIGFFLLGPLAFSYYTLQDEVFRHLVGEIGPDRPWWWVPSHIAIDQTIYALTYNVVFYSAVGLGRGDGLSTVVADLKANMGKLMTAGWKLWPFVHIITYGVIPSEHKVLWVDSVDILWAFILCVLVNQKRDTTVKAIESIDGPVQEGVLASIDSYVAGVREIQWEEELSPSEQGSFVFKSNMPDQALLQANKVEQLAASGVTQLIEGELQRASLEESGVPCFVLERVPETQASGDEWVTGAEAVNAAGAAAEQWDEASAALACGEMQSLSRFEQFTALPTEEQVMVADVLAAALEEARSDSKAEHDDEGDNEGTGKAQEAAGESQLQTEEEEDLNVSQ